MVVPEIIVGAAVTAAVVVVVVVAARVFVVAVVVDVADSAISVGEPRILSQRGSTSLSPATRTIQ